MFRRWGASPVPGPFELDGIISDGAAGVPSVRWVWLGDSLSAGVGANQADQSFPRQAAALVAAQAACDVELICVAIPGASAADVLVEQVPAATRMLHEGTVAVVVVGCNDVLRMVRPSVFRATYTALVEVLGATGATVVAVGVPDLGSMILVMAQPLRVIVGWAARRADAVVREVALETDAYYVPISRVRLSGRRRDQLEGSLLSTDRWHPNGDGYRLWAGLVVPALLGLAPERRPSRRNGQRSRQTIAD